MKNLWLFLFLNHMVNIWALLCLFFTYAILFIYCNLLILWSQFFLFPIILLINKLRWYLLTSLLACFLTSFLPSFLTYLFLYNEMFLLSTLSWKKCYISYIFFYLGFLSWTLTNHRTAGEGGGHFFNSHYHFHPLHRHLDISRVITAESSTLHIYSLGWIKFMITKVSDWKWLKCDFKNLRFL